MVGERKGVVIMSDSDKPAFSIRVESGDVEDPRTQLRNAVKQLRETLADQIEFHKMIAKITKIRYDAYINEGFNPEQALFLCTK